MGLRSFVLAAAAVGFVALAGVASAQVVGPPGAQTPREELNPAQNAPPPSTKPRNDDLFGSPEAGPCPLANSTLRFTLKSVDFTGAYAVRLRDLAASYQIDVGQEIGLSELCQIRDRANDILFRQGLLARVEVPEQKIEGGHLSLHVTEAHVVSVQVRGDAGPAQEQVETFVDKLRGMRPFDIRKAQRYLLLASDIPGVRVSAALRPDEEGEGAVILIVTVSRKPIDAVVNIQDYGSAALGPFGGVARLDLNGFTRFGERTSLVVYSTLANTEQEVFEGLTEGRIGSEGLTWHGSASYALSAPGGELAPLKLNGRSLVVEAAISYPLIRTRRRNVNVGAGFDLIDQQTDFGAGGVLSEDNLRVFYAHIDAQQQWRTFNRFLPLVALSGDMDVRQGVDGLGSSSPGDTTLSRIGGRPDGFVVRGDLHLDVSLTSRFGGRISFLGQYSPTPLLAYEQFAIGNLTVGRGYDPSALTGDEGMGGSFEVHAGPFDPPAAWKLPAGMNATVFAFYDIAAVYNHAPGTEDRTIHSAGAGVSFQLTPRVRLDLSYAHPFDKTSDFSPHAPDSRVLMSLTTSIL